jgi:hypothetical protein
VVREGDAEIVTVATESRFLASLGMTTLVRAVKGYGGAIRGVDGEQATFGWMGAHHTLRRNG